MSDHSVGQHLLGGFDGYSVTPDVCDLILKKKILGFTLFKWNIESPEQLVALTGELKSLANQAGYEIILGVDQEGGRVARLPVPPFTEIPPMREWGNKVKENGDFTVIQQLGALAAQEVRAAGFNLDFAPVVDVDLNPDNPVIGDRSFSNEAWHVYLCAKFFLKGLMSGGVIGCLKHFPGHGATDLDSHFALPHDPRSLNDLLDCDLLPYGKLIVEGCAPSIMTAHVVYDAIDPDNPATLSEKIVGGLLRDQLGYDGVVFSDDLLMKAIGDHHDILDVVLRFFEIGGDVVLVCRDAALNLELIERLEEAFSKPSNQIEKILKNRTQAQRRLQGLKLQHLSLPDDVENLDCLLARHHEFVKTVFSG